MSACFEPVISIQLAPSLANIFSLKYTGALPHFTSIISTVWLLYVIGVIALVILVFKSFGKSDLEILSVINLSSWSFIPEIVGNPLKVLCGSAGGALFNRNGRCERIKGENRRKSPAIEVTYGAFKIKS